MSKFKKGDKVRSKAYPEKLRGTVKRTDRAGNVYAYYLKFPNEWRLMATENELELDE